MLGGLRVLLKFSLIDCLDGWISQVSSDAGTERMVTIIPTTCAPQLVSLAMAVGANHWPKHWPAAALMVGRRRNMLKLLAGPGEVPRL